MVLNSEFYLFTGRRKKFLILPKEQEVILDIPLQNIEKIFLIEFEFPRLLVISEQNFPLQNISTDKRNYSYFSSSSIKIS